MLPPAGFLGLLHLEVFSQRLEQEHNIPVIISSPSVPYEIELDSGELLKVSGPSQMPDPTKVVAYREPKVEGTFIFPREYTGT